jgi:integrase
MTGGRYHKRFTAATIAFMDDGGASASTETRNTTPLRYAAHLVLEEHYKRTSRYNHSRRAYADLCDLFPDADVETLSTTMLRQWVGRMEARGNKASTINANLSTIGVMLEHLDVSDPCRVPYLPKRKELKWWLSPEVEQQATAWMAAKGYDDLRDFMRFVVLTGLRVKEALRCGRMHFTGIGTDRPTLSVPGTKTAMAQAAIPLLPEAAALVRIRMGDAGGPEDYLFKVRYHTLQTQWMECRKALGITSTTATLKSFRRSFARVASDRGTPTEIIQKLLRHEMISTTMDYLRLTGGSDVERMRQWLR